MNKRSDGLPLLMLLVLNLTGCPPGRDPSAEGAKAVDDLAAGQVTPPSPAATEETPASEVSVLIPESEVYSETSDIYLQYGELRVRPGEAAFESPIRPWSGYWLPARSDYLFAGAGSPLAIWDSFVRALPLPRSQGGGAVQWEKTLYEQNHQPLSWEGACDAWAIASLYEFEPTEPRAPSRGTRLSVGAQKALLVRSWDWVEEKRVYGRPYRGDRESLWDEPSPAGFHRFMISELFEQSRPFIIDKDPGIPVWNTPIFGAFTRLRDDPVDINSVLVRTWLKGVDPLFHDPEEQKNPITWIELAYRLSGKRQADGSLRVTGGAWLQDEETGVDSTLFHPDFLVGLPPRGEVPAHGSFNPGIGEADWMEFRSRLGLSYRTP